VAGFILAEAKHRAEETGAFAAEKTKILKEMQQKVRVKLPPLTAFIVKFYSKVSRKVSCKGFRNSHFTAFTVK